MERIGILKLNGSNCGSWKTKVEFLLARDNLWRYVIGTSPAVSAEASGSGDAAAEVEAWNNGDQKAHSTIVKVSLRKQICDKRYADGKDIEWHVFKIWRTL